MRRITIGRWDIELGYRPKSNHKLTHYKRTRTLLGTLYSLGKFSLLIEDWTDEAFATCGECGSHEVTTRTAGDESWDVCPDCRTVEGTIRYVNKRTIEGML